MADKLDFVRHSGELEKKGRVRQNWKNRHFVLRAGTDQGAAGGTGELQWRDTAEGEAIGNVLVLGVFDVPDRGGRARANRFDLHCRNPELGEHYLALTAASPSDKADWIRELADVSKVLALADHPRAAEFDASAAKE